MDATRELVVAARGRAPDHRHTHTPRAHHGVLERTEVPSIAPCAHATHTLRANTCVRTQLRAHCTSLHASLHTLTPRARPHPPHTTTSQRRCRWPSTLSSVASCLDPSQRRPRRAWARQQRATQQRARQQPPRRVPPRLVSPQGPEPAPFSCVVEGPAIEPAAFPMRCGWTCDRLPVVADGVPPGMEEGFRLDLDHVAGEVVLLRWGTDAEYMLRPRSRHALTPTSRTTRTARVGPRAVAHHDHMVLLASIIWSTRRHRPPTWQVRAPSPHGTPPSPATWRPQAFSCRAQRGGPNGATDDLRGRCEVCARCELH
jgi:hypothetical protein